MMGCSSTRPHRGTGTHSPSFLASSPHALSTPMGLSIHVGRAGNVDLSSRKIDFLGSKIVSMIQEDTLHRKATSLTLTDNFLYTLGKELTLLPELEEIDMDANKFQRLPESLAELPNLWRINASANPLKVEHGFDFVPRLRSLRSLTLRSCNLTCVPDKLRECVTLEELDFADNPGMRISDFDFAELTKLRKLSVVKCNLSGDTLPEGMKHNKLVALDISDNSFTFEDNNFFGNELPTSLQELHLCKMELTSVPEVVIVLKKLIYLDLAENPIETLDVLAGRLVKRLPRIRSGSTINTQMSKTGTNGNSDYDGTPLVEHPHLNSNSTNSNTDSNRSVSRKKSELLLDAPNNSSNNANNINNNENSSKVNEEENNGDDSKDDDKDDDDVASNVASEGGESETSRISMSKVSKAGIVATISQPIHLKKLSLRACGLRTVPKYFHKMDFIEELDLSENNLLNDPNMTLFSLSKLRVLNITGCPFAMNPTRSNNEWFDIAKLNNLVDLQWEIWRGVHNATLYRTRIPLEICGLPLTRINEVPLRKDLFVGDTVETAVNLFRDGYYKVDLSMDDKTVYSYGEALKTLLTSEPFFFFPLERRAEQCSEYTHTQNTTAAAGANGINKKSNEMDNASEINFDKINELHLRIAINRYIFFLALQTANYDAVIIPPLDVMTIHMSQLTISPLKYRNDCEAISGRILNCNYRNFFIEEQRHALAARDATAKSKKIWNLMVRSAQRDLKWLRYDFWEKLARVSFDSTHASASSSQIVSANGSKVDNKNGSNSIMPTNSNTINISSNSNANTIVTATTQDNINLNINDSSKPSNEVVSIMAKADKLGSSIVKGVTFAVEGIAEHSKTYEQKGNDIKISNNNSNSITTTNTNANVVNSPTSPQPSQQMQDATNANNSSSPSTTPSNILPLPSFQHRTDAELRNYWTHLSSFDSSKDLAGVLDQAITFHFSEQGESNFRETLRAFFNVGSTFVRHESALRALRLSWTRYAKFLVLYAYRINVQNLNDGTVIMYPMADEDGNLYAPQTLSSMNPTYLNTGTGYVRRAWSALTAQYNEFANSFSDPSMYLPRPPMSTTVSRHNSTLNNNNNNNSRENNANGNTNSATSAQPYRTVSNITRRPSALTMALTRSKSSTKDNARITAMREFTTNPVPTLGITLLLHVHRTSHVRYYQTLSLLGIEAIDVSWEETNEAIRQTKKAWSALYDESYLATNVSSSSSALHANTLFSGENGMRCNMNDRAGASTVERENSRVSNNSSNRKNDKREQKRSNSRQKSTASSYDTQQYESSYSSSPASPQPAVYDAKAKSPLSARVGKKGSDKALWGWDNNNNSNSYTSGNNEKRKRRVVFSSGDAQYGVF